MRCLCSKHRRCSYARVVQEETCLSQVYEVRGGRNLLPDIRKKNKECVSSRALEFHCEGSPPFEALLSTRGGPFRLLLPLSRPPALAPPGEGLCPVACSCGRHTPRKYVKLSGRTLCAVRNACRGCGTPEFQALDFFFFFFGTTHFKNFCAQQRRHSYLCTRYLEPQSRFGDNPLEFQVLCPQVGTAVLKGLYGMQEPVLHADITISREP